MKEYLSKGERFIKWDDVSTGVFALLGCMHGDRTDTVFWFVGRLGACTPWGDGMLCVVPESSDVWTGRAN